MDEDFWVVVCFLSFVYINMIFNVVILYVRINYRVDIFK